MWLISLTLVYTFKDSLGFVQMGKLKLEVVGWRMSSS